jgi:hypothetical protein
MYYNFGAKKRLKIQFCIFRFGSPEPMNPLETAVDSAFTEEFKSSFNPSSMQSQILILGQENHFSSHHKLTEIQEQVIFSSSGHT